MTLILVLFVPVFSHGINFDYEKDVGGTKSLIDRDILFQDKKSLSQRAEKHSLYVSSDSSFYKLYERLGYSDYCKIYYQLYLKHFYILLKHNQAGQQIKYESESAKIISEQIIDYHESRALTKNPDFCKNREKPDRDTRFNKFISVLKKIRKP